MTDTQIHNVEAHRANVAHYDREIIRLEVAQNRVKARQADEAATLADKHRNELADLSETLRSHSQNRHNAIMALADAVIAEAETNEKDAPNGK